MNKISEACYRPSLNFSFLSQQQVDILTMINSVVMIRNVGANILIKTKQLANNTFKLNFMQSASDLMIGLFGQNLKATILCE